MGREVRMVPPGWQHPIEHCKDRSGYGAIRFRPLHARDWRHEQAEWDEEHARWLAGYVKSYSKDGDGWEPKPDDAGTEEEWHGKRPDPADYMPDFEPGTATHLMMYETCSEGTPISPSFATPEQLARWLADNEASAFGNSKASYEGWPRVAQGGYAPTAVIVGGVMTSGVDGITK